jgi:hypothetical protein
MLDRLAFATIQGTIYCSGFNWALRCVLVRRERMLRDRKWTFVAATAAVTLFTVGVRANTVDLTTVGSSGEINDAWYVQTGPQPTGTGVIQPFVRIQGTGTEAGYNTDYRPVEFQTKDQNQWTHSLLLSSVPIVSYRGGQYRQFLLDINEGGNTNLARLSLDEVQIFLGAAGDLHNYPSGLGTLIYDMDAAPDGPGDVELNYRLNSGSGSGDMFLYVPVEKFAQSSNPYVYLYSHFGTPNASDAGFEEWSTIQQESPPVGAPGVPLPSSALGGIGLMGLTAARCRRLNK